MESAFNLKKENPKRTSNSISKLFFAWIVKLYYKGTKQKLQLHDLYKTLDSDESERLGNKLEKEWNEEVRRKKENKNGDYKPSLFKAMSRTFFWEYMWYGVILFAYQVMLRTPQPFVLSILIKQFQTPNAILNRAWLYGSAGLLVGLSTFMIFFMHHGNFGQACIGMRIRIAVSSLVYRKIMRLSKTSQGQTPAGTIVNMLSNDVQRFDMVMLFLHYVWIMPFQVAIVTYFLWSSVGISCCAGILSMALCTLPLQTYFSKLTSILRLRVAQRTDSRVKLMSEIISGIQVIKMYAWEKPFEKMIQYLRHREIKVLTQASYLRGFMMSCMVFIERTTLFLTVICYVLLGNSITADIVFSMAQYFNILQGAMAIMFPLAITWAAESWVAIVRLESLLVLDEKQTSVIQKASEKEIKIVGVTASYIPDVPVLKQIELRVPKGSLCAVVGPVGAGKSSLLQLLLGEIVPSKGNVHIGGQVAYSSQEPWLFAATVRNNILFGRPYESAHYKRVAHVCALKKDFEQFPQGDHTKVGERGVSLSGGQRARINLARAIYGDSDIYLLDDPLSAVDTHVGKHLFNKCIVKHLEGKTRILVTHQLQYLQKADIIVVLNEGIIEAIGTFEELSNSKLDFTKLLADNNESNDEKEKEKLPFENSVEWPEGRRTSHMSLVASYNEKSIIEDDTEESGDPNATPFKDYYGSVKNWCLVALMVTLLVSAQAACAGSDYWVSFWTTQEELRHQDKTVLFNPNSPVQIEVYDMSNNSIRLDPYTYTQNLPLNLHAKSLGDNILDQVEHQDGTVHTLLKSTVAMYIYGALIIAAIGLTIGRSIFYYKVAMEASKNLHAKMFHCLLKTPMRFFDINPSGRVLNRFSKDMGAIDEILPRVLLEAIQILLVMAGILVNVAASNYYMIIAIVVLGYVFLKIRGWYLANAKVIKHLEGIAKSPVFSHITSSLHGLTTIRAANMEKSLIKGFDDHQNVHTSAWFLTIMCTESFGLWLDIVAVLFTAIVTFAFIIALDLGASINPSSVGLAISQSLILTGMLQYGMRQTAEVINQLISVERVMQYTKLDTEGPFETDEKAKPQKPWPRKGLVQFENLSLTYVRGDPPVLKNLTFTIKPGEKVGIVGRTGAGKSSLISALFRLAPLEGHIYIDHVDTKKIGLNDLRRSVSIIPQEPVLFSSSLRYNLDPFGEFEDQKLWEVLEEVELKDLVSSLDFQVSEGGGNFSLGQRQLLCLARAILRNNKIMVLDEATANVDARTDSLIQKTIRKKFKDCTVLTIAHRLNTIMDSDKVIVMGFGKVLELDHPHILLQDENSHFTKMVLETGESMTQTLKGVAKVAYLTNESSDDEFELSQL